MDDNDRKFMELTRVDKAWIGFVTALAMLIWGLAILAGAEALWSYYNAGN